MKKRLAAIATAFFVITMPIWGGQVQADQNTAATKASTAVVATSSSAASQNSTSLSSATPSASMTSSSSHSTESSSVSSSDQPKADSTPTTTGQKQESPPVSSTKSSSAQSQTTASSSNQTNTSSSTKATKQSTDTTTKSSTGSESEASSSMTASSQASSTDVKTDKQTQSSAKQTSESTSTKDVRQNTQSNSKPTKNVNKIVVPKARAINLDFVTVDDVSNTDNSTSTSDTTVSDLRAKIKAENPSFSEKDIDAAVIDSVQLTYTDAHNNPTTSPTIDSGISFLMNLYLNKATFGLVNMNDTYTYQLPKGVKITELQSGNIVNSKNHKDNYGSYTINEDGLLTLKLTTTSTNQGDDFTGSLNFDGKFNQDAIKTPGDATTVFKFPGAGTSSTVTVHPKVASSIEKAGNANKSLDPSAIEWQVIFNKTMDALTTPVLTENFDTAKVKYGSVVIHPVTMDFNGNATVDKTKALVAGADYRVSDGTDGHPAGSIIFLIPISQAYEADYESPILDNVVPRDDNKNIKNGTLAVVNSATLSAKEITPITATASVNAVYQGLFAKTAGTQNGDKDQFQHIYHWTIKYNYGEDNLDNNQRTLTDVVTAPQAFVNPSSLKIYVVNYDAKTDTRTIGAALNESRYTLTPSADKSGFVLTFEKGFDQAVNISYDTQATQDQQVITNDVAANKDKNGDSQGIPIVNTAKVNGYDNVTPYTAPDKAAGDLIKHADWIDRGLKTVVWSADINKSNYMMTNYTFTDTAVNAGLQGPYVPQNTNKDLKFGVEIEDETGDQKGHQLVPGTDYDVKAINSAINGGNTEFKVTLKGKDYGKTDHQLLMRYMNIYDVSLIKTPIETENHTFKNQATGSWTDDSGKPFSDTVTAQFDGTQQEAYQGSKVGSYNPATKQITWQVISNYNAKNYTNYTLYDPIVGNQTIIPNSILVEQSEISNVGVFNEDSKVIKKATNYSVKIYHGKVNGNKFDYDSYTLNGASFNKTGSIDFGDPDTGVQGNAYLMPTGSGYYQLGSEADGTGNKAVTQLLEIDFGSGDKPLAGTTDTDGRVQLAFRVTFKTSVDNTQVANNYPNTALMDYPDPSKLLNNPRVTVAASVSPYEGKPYLSKSGQRVTGTSTADWNVVVNRSQSEIANAMYTDTLSVNQQLIGGVIHVYRGAPKWSSKPDWDTANEAVRLVKKGGIDTKEYETVVAQGDELVNGTDYTYTLFTDPITGQQMIQIKFISPIKSSYLLSYNTKLFAPEDPTATTDVDYTNSAKLERNDTDNKPIETVDSDKIVISHSEAIGFSTFNSINLVKLLSDGIATDEKKLSGITFKLLTVAGDPKTMIRTAVSDKDGKFSFINLRENIYYLYEDSVSAYKVNPDMIIAKDLGKGTRALSVNGASTVAIVPTTIRNFFGRLDLTKVDGNNLSKLLSGAIFKLQKKNDVGDFADFRTGLTTGENGLLQVGNLPVGVYQFVETNAPAGYIRNLTPSESLAIAVPDGDAIPTAEITMKNYYGRFVLTKNGDNKLPLTGVKYQLIDSKNQKTDYYTDSKGQVVLDSLAPGDYALVELQALKGYLLDTAPVNFKIPEDIVDGQYSDKRVVVNYTDVVTFTKTDVHDHVLANAVYELLDSKGNAVSLKADDNGNFVVANGIRSTQFTTNVAGQFKIYGLAAGDYQLHEVTAPTGFAINPVNTTFTVNAGSKTDATAGAKDYQGQLVFTKTLSGQGSAAGAEYRLVGKNYDKTFITNAAGSFTVDDLALGSYTLTETKAPMGYQINPLVLTVTVAADKGASKTIPVTAGQIDYQGSASLIKVMIDHKDNDAQKPLVGAEFSVYKADGTLVKAGLVSDAEGLVTISQLAPGTYYFLEIQAPQGFQINDRHVQFKVGTKSELVDGKPKTIDAGVLIDHRGLLKIHKTDTADSNVNVAGAEYTVFDSNKQKIKSGTTDQNGNIDISELGPGAYTFKETQAPSLYGRSAQTYEFTVIATTQDTETVVKDVNDAKIPTTSIKVTKTWLGIPDGVVKPNLVVATLYIDGKASSQSLNLTKDKGYSDSFKGLATTDQDGKAVVYTVVETSALSGYTVETNGERSPVNGAVALVNRFVPLKTQIKVTKVWDGTPVNVVNPNIAAILYANGVVKAQAALTSVDGWTASFDGLDQTDAAGKTIVYTVAEGIVPEGYLKETVGPRSVADNAVILKNWFIPLKTQVKVIKTWLGTPLNVQNPEIIAVLYVNDKPSVKQVTLNSADNWSGDFTNLDQTDADGKVIVYTVAEQNVPAGYTSETLGQQAPVTGVVTLKNRFTPLKTNVKINKQWLGMPVGVTAPEIKAVLYINGKATDTTVTLNAENHYAADFNNLDETDVNGDQINYTVAEQVIPSHYVAITSGAQSRKNGIVILRNRYIPSTTDLRVTKTWVNVQDGVALPSVKVVLYRNGIVTAQTVELSTDNQWQASFTNLATTDDAGAQINWAVKEQNIPTGFTASYQANGMQTTITNTAKLGEARLHKADVVTGVALSGAVFNLLDSKGRVIKTGLTTDAEGNLTVTDLKWGNYSFVETKAPVGYELSTKPLTFTVNDQTADTGVQVTFTNTELPQPPTVYPPTGDYPHTPEVPGYPGVPETPGVEGPKGHLPKSHHPKRRLPKQPHVVNYKPVVKHPAKPAVLRARHTTAQAGKIVLAAPGKPAKGNGKSAGLPQTDEQANPWTLVGAAMMALLALFGLQRKFRN